VKREAEKTLEQIREFLKRIQFPERRNTGQTAVCIYALLDTKPRKGLLPEKSSLNDGARIHDILEFARRELKIRVAENTRETYRKHSLKPLLGAKLITRFRSAVNDPNTHYVLNKALEAALRDYLVAKRETEKQKAVTKWAATAAELIVRPVPVERAAVVVKIDDQTRTLSPGKHNLLIKDIIEVFAPIFIDSPRVLYLGDAEHKMKQSDPLAASLGLKLDEHEKLPDVILYSTTRNIIFIVEAVTSAGPIDDARIRAIEVTIFPTEKTVGVEYFTAFPNRNTFRRFVQDIAWGTQVWFANEPFGVVIFRKVR